MTHIAAHATSLIALTSALLMASPARAREVDAGDAERRDDFSTITLTDGQELTGRVLGEGPVYRIELSSGAVLEVPASAIERIERSRGPAGARDTHRVSYLFSPSGMMLRAGEGYLSQRELIYTTFGYGVTDFLTVEAGTALPLWFVSPSGPAPNLTAGVKLGGNPWGDLHTSMAAQGLFSLGQFSGPAAGMLLSGNATYGGPSAHVSLNLGVPLTGNERDQLLMVTTLSGYYQLTDVFGGITEHWLTVSPEAQGAILFNSLGGRFTPGDFAIDVGVVLLGNVSRGEVEYAPLPLPWVNVSWGFGG